jgi:cytochrome c nitrite reductase small subunit
MDTHEPTDEPVEELDQKVVEETTQAGGGDTADEAPEEELPGRATPKRTILAGVLVAVFAFVALFPLFLSATPKACATCHYVKPYYASWAKDRHRATTSCLACHLEPGIKGIVTYPFFFYAEALTAVSGGAIDPPVKNFPSDEACMRKGCHSKNRLESLGGEFKVDHRKHADEGVACHRCHRGAGHRGQKGMPLLPTMKSCAKCHPKEVAGKCDYCHNAKSLPRKPGQ